MNIMSYLFSILRLAKLP